jgi:chromodomain-helicase-DNA-binding protein 4
MGKWQCPRCFEENDQVKPVDHLDSISKRARTKTVPVKSKAEVNPINLEKVSGIFGNKHVSKKRSAKAKSVSTMGGKFFGVKPLSSPVEATCSDKPMDPSLESCKEGTSSCVDADDKNLNVSPTVSPMDTIPASPDKEVLSPSKITNVDANDDLLEEKPDLSCDKIPFRKTLVLGITAGGEEMRKRKLKVINDNSNQKKRRTEKGKFFAVTPTKSKSGNNKVHKKQKSKTHKISTSISKGDVGKKKSDVQRKDKVLALLLISYKMFTSKNL